MKKSFVFVLFFLFCLSIKSFAIFNIITDGDPLLASPIMQNFRHVNFGNALIPVNSNGVATNNALDLGTSSVYWRNFYLAGTANITNLAVGTNALFSSVAGSVGIGTTTPQKLLDLNNLSPVIRLTSTRDFAGAISTDTGIIEFYTTDPSGVGPRVLSSIKSYSSSGSASPEGNIIFSTGDFQNTAIERLRINSTGNIGIGTTTPYAYDTTPTLLSVQAQITTATETEVVHFTGGLESSGGAGVFRLTNSNDRGIVLKGGQTGTSEFGEIGVSRYDGSYTQGLYINPSGYIGLGTTTPGAKLTVSGNAYSASTGLSSSLLLSTSTKGNSIYSAGIGFRNGDSAAERASITAIQDTTDEDNLGLSFFTHPSTTGSDPRFEAVRISSSGKVGVGLTNPSEALHVSGNFRVTGNISVSSNVQVAGGISSGLISPVNLKWARIALGTKNIVGGLSNDTTLFTVNLAQLGSSFTLLNYSLTLIGDNGLVIGSAENILSFAENSGYMQSYTPMFTFVPVNQNTIEIHQIFLFGGMIDYYNNYFQNNAANWDDTTNNRGYLEVFYAN